MLPSTASADFGPKPQLIITVTDPPEDPYYLDLMVEEKSFTCTDANLSQDDLLAMNPDMLNMLRTNWASEGWYPALSGGATTAPMWGSLSGEPQDSAAPEQTADAQTQTAQTYKHSFYYMGVPDTYRIAIVTEKGDTRITEVLTRDLLQERITYNYRTGEIEKAPIAIAYAIQFASTFLATLLIEGIILLIFKFPFGQNRTIFFLVNFVTQVAMTVTVGTKLIHEGTITAMMSLIPIELIILVVETVVYLFLLKGQSRPKRIIYAVVANVASAGISLALMSPIFSLLGRF